MVPEVWAVNLLSVCLICAHRRLWQHVTKSLKEGNIDEATEHKHRLEERQRGEERQRAADNKPWTPKYFTKEVQSREISSRDQHYSCSVIQWITHSSCWQQQILLLWSTDVTVNTFFSRESGSSRAAGASLNLELNKELKVPLAHSWLTFWSRQHNSSHMSGSRLCYDPSGTVFFFFFFLLAPWKISEELNLVPVSLEKFLRVKNVIFPTYEH